VPGDRKAESELQLAMLKMHMATVVRFAFFLEVARGGHGAG